MRVLAASLIALSLVAGVARAALFRGTEGPDKIVGSPTADTVYGLAGNDVIRAGGGPDFINPGFGRDTVYAGAGADRIAAQDDALDAIFCGAGLDVVTADSIDGVAADCETVSRQISRDTTTDFFAQHETQVEPDSFASGRTVVTAFQSGRIANGGAAGLGFSTSKDAGVTWRGGMLSNGPYRIVSDPVVAYDSVHGWWLVAGLGAGSGLLDIYVIRSRDGITWGQPLRAAGDVDEDYDKEWIACDNGAKSKFRGTCYLAYVDVRTHWLALRTSTDGGATWSKPSRMQPGIEGSTFSGPMPVVQPDGDVVVPYVLYAPIDVRGAEDHMAAVISRNGGATWSDPVRIAHLMYEEPFELRAPTMPSVDVDAAGRLFVVWSDSRFRNDGSSMDVVLSTSTNGMDWSDPAKISGSVAGLDFIPAVAVDPATSGKTARVAVAYYTLRLRPGCALFVPGCGDQVDAWLIISKSGGASWTRPQRLNAEPMNPDWLADTTLGRMLGDYISVSWSGGHAIPALAAAGEPGFSLTQAIFTTRAAAS